MAETLPTFTPKPIYCGDTAVLPIQCRRADGVTPIALPNGTQLKATLKGDNNVIAGTFAINSGIVVTDQNGGNANLQLLQVHTDQPAGNYTLDVLCIELDGTRTTISGTVPLVDHPSR